MRITAVAVAVVTASSCVTLYGGAVHRVRVTSAPPGARVFVDGEHTGATPVRVTVSSRDPEVVITVEKDGYPTVSRRLQRSRSVGRILASIGIGAGFGFITSLAINRQLDDYNPLSSAIGFLWPMIDSLSGALFKFPDRVDVRLVSPGPAGHPRRHRALHRLGRRLPRVAGPDRPWSPERRRQERQRRLGGLASGACEGVLGDVAPQEREHRLGEPRRVPASGVLGDVALQAR